ncbi:Bug family tripartite tricarboxylate transporter substrate binding protein [Variovorax sp. GB1P17]|uniref:Bug family tripartite tricarboxylate transporter substrate binding protein n=1 Tax=Variovorax sp. GB1P17 TaxID=3443740 RepID=UPI003F4593C1
MDFFKRASRLMGMLGGIAIAACALVPQAAMSAGYPTKPIRLVVGFPPGQATDVIARIVAKQLQDSLGQAVIVDNKPGAGGINGTQEVARSPADGYTLLVSSSGPLAVNPSLYPKLPYSVERDFDPVTLLASLPLYLAVNPSFEAQDFNGLMQIVKRSPGKYEYASAGNGVTSHLTMELIKNQFGLFLVHVPYRGSSPAINDVMAGQVPMTIDTGPAVLPMAQAGKLRVLGVTTGERSALTPQIPTIAEQTKTSFDVRAWVGIVAPKGTPADVIAILHKAIDNAWHKPEIRSQLATLGGEAKTMQPAAFGRLIQEETVKFARAVKLSGAKVD